MGFPNIGKSQSAARDVFSFRGCFYGPILLRMRRELAGWLLIFCACSSSNTPAPAPGPSASQQCAEYLGVWCDQNVTCAIVLGVFPETDRSSQMSDCEANLRSTIDCSRAIVNGSVSACERDTRAIPCDLWDSTAKSLPLPASCNRLFLQ